MKVTTVENLVVPTGEYLAEVIEIKEERGDYGPQFKWRFEILQPEQFAGKLLTGWTSQSPNLKGKFVRWATGFLGRAIGPREVLNTDDLVGSRAILTVTVKEGTDGDEFNKIEGIRAHRKPRPEPKTNPEAVANDDFDPFGEE